MQCIATSKFHTQQLVNMVKLTTSRY